MAQTHSHTQKMKQLARQTVGIAMVLAVASCANSPKISIPIYETPVAYAGLGAGGSMLDVDTTDKNFDQRGSTSTAAQLTLGIEMADSWALEVRAADLGDAEFDNDLKLGYQVADLTLMGKHSLGSRAKVFGRFGVGMLENDGDFDVRQRNQTHVVLGAGFDFEISRRFGLRIEAMGHDVDASHAQLSLIYRFNPRAAVGPSTSASTATAIPANQSVSIRAPASSNSTSTSKAIVNPTEPSITPIPIITPKPAQVERQTKPRKRNPVKPKPLSTLAADADRDGVADALDACAGTPADAIVNTSGCDFYGTAAPGVVFADGESTLDASSIAALNEIVENLKKFPTIKVVIGAYSPLTGDSAADLLLSRRRTIAVIRYMRSAGVESLRTQPIAKALVAKEGGEALVNRIAIRQHK